MSNTSRGTTRRLLASIGMLILGLGAILVGFASTAGSANAVADKITFCHYAGSNDNGGSGNWVGITTSKAAFYNAGHIDHTNDVFPAGSYKGQSWAAQGDQSMIGAGCDSDTDTQTQTRTVDGEPDCEAGTVAFDNQERTRTVTNGVPGEWSEWATVSSGSRDVVEGECPDVLGEESELRDVKGAPDCEAGTVTVSHQKRTRATTNGVPGPWGEWNEVSSSTIPVTAKQCPDEIETLPTESTAPNPGEPEGDEPEVLGIAKKAPAPAAAPTAVAAGLGGEESSSNSTLWILAGGALALAGLTLGFAPAPARGKRAL